MIRFCWAVMVVGAILAGSVGATEPLMGVAPVVYRSPEIRESWFYSTQFFNGEGQACMSCHLPGSNRPFSRRVLTQRNLYLNYQVRQCIEDPNRVNGRVDQAQIDTITDTIRAIFRVP